MYYHLIIEQTIKNSEKIYVYDLSEEQLINDYVEPYSSGKCFIVDGYNLDKTTISRFKIVSTENMVLDEISKIRAQNKRFSIMFNKENIVDSDTYSKDETNNILKNYNVNKIAQKVVNKKYVFIVHGRDHNKVTEIENFVRCIGYEPIVLFKEADKGLTIIEKIEKYTSESIYAIVLYTKCDEGYLANHPEEKKYRARQNVVFEHGYLMAKLGRSNVCAILEDNSIEYPGDISGVIYKTFDESGLWKYAIAKEMIAANINVDLNKIK